MHLPRSRPLGGVVCVFMALGTVSGCTYRLERKLVPADSAHTLDHRSPYLKAHLRNGYVYVLSNWVADAADATILGSGSLLDANRTELSKGEFRIPRDSVVLFETNVVRQSGAGTALTVMAGITAAVAGFCAASPKTCFGSCPTFYAPDSAGETLQAEGFSSSIAPALEATDIDMLYRVRPRGRELTLRVANEALETHVIRHANLLALKRPPAPGGRTGRVFVTPDGRFRSATAARAPTRCQASEGDCLPAIVAFDGRERTSLADSTDLAARETIDLAFEATPAGDLGLVISARQTLMTTYLIYQALAYMGSEATRWLAALQTGGPQVRAAADALSRALGRIEVLVPDGGGAWTPAASFSETGPLAADTKVLPLPPGAAGTGQVRLRLTRGMWRLDYVALAVLGDTLEPRRIRPERVRRGGRDDPAALRLLLDSSSALTTLPGDTYQLVYQLPSDFDQYDLFLESRGYYLEWMRREWMAEENRAEALRMLFDPGGALRALAPAYKRVEPLLERLFWNSRYVRH